VVSTILFGLPSSNRLHNYLSYCWDFVGEECKKN
jgi:hypothetical protein